METTERKGNSTDSVTKSHGIVGYIGRVIPRRNRSLARTTPTPSPAGQARVDEGALARKQELGRLFEGRSAEEIARMKRALDNPDMARYLTEDQMNAFGRSFPWGNERIPIGMRLFEILVSGTALLIAAPILLALVLIIRKGSSGPALFSQTRIGVNMKPFKFYKLRTMYADGKERFPHLYAYKFEGQDKKKIKFKVNNDPRVTPQGAWIRRYSLDELLNFWSVLKGDMALVGPRPEIPQMIPHYDQVTLKKFTVRPGITGFTQTRGRGRLTFAEGLAHDMEYVEKRNWRVDVATMFKTFDKIVTEDGSL